MTATLDPSPPATDLPFPITGRKWLIVMAAAAAGYLALILLRDAFTGPVSGLLPVVLFAVLPFTTLVWAAGPQWTALFRPITGRAVALTAAFAGLTIVVTLVLGALTAVTVGVAVSREATDLMYAPPTTIGLFYPRTLVQDFGQELIAILAFLALLWALLTRGRIARRQSVVMASVITAIGFGLVHWATDGGNVVQSILVIGGTRLVLTLAYVVTKNLWVSVGAHVLTDWILFSVPVIAVAAIH